MHHFTSIPCPVDFEAFSEVIDVRSPEEFAVDHLPNAINLPVLTDEERVHIGKVYRHSPFEARKQGAALISANAARYLEKYFNTKPPEYRPLLYCWRGGMRSRSLTHILVSIGWKAHILDGGYRAFRKWIVSDLERMLTSENLKVLVLSGLTGVGKTKMLRVLQQEQEQVVDLEFLANHKGSLLGAPLSGTQPSQKQFETRLWHLLQSFDLEKPVWIESESNRIGNVHCPPALWQKLATSTLIELDLSLEHRTQLLRSEYSHFQENPQQLSRLLDSLRRLRGNAMVDRWQDNVATDQWEDFIHSILQDHYDVSYRKTGDKKSIYPSPSHYLTLESASNSAYKKGALELMRYSV